MCGPKFMRKYVTRSIMFFVFSMKLSDLSKLNFAYNGMVV
jgi:hypothetical protein